MSVFSKEYCEKMRVRIDCGNMLAEAVGKHGITAEEISEMLPRAEGAFAGVEKKSGEMRWRLLPETQLEILPAVEEAAEFVRSKADNFVILGIGGSALGPIAVHRALNHLYHNDLPSEKRKSPRLFVEDNVDPERMAALLDVIDTDRTVFNVITKSGSTSETMAQLLIITRMLIDRYGEEGLRDHLIATTDKQKGNLIGIAKKYSLRTFIIPDGVGGRFSELCPVGLVAAAVGGADVLRKPFFTYETQKVSSLLAQMREKSVSFSIVLDEYGVTAGLITLEDIVEEIFGELRDEYDDSEEETFKKLSDGSYMVSASLKLDDLDDLLDVDLDSEDYDSLGGYIIELLDHLPSEGETAEDEHFLFKVVSVDKNRMETIHIIPKEQ